MTDQDEIQSLIKEGVEAARAGDKAKARELFQAAADMDMNNERAWLWLASVTDDTQEKRIYIENVLHINPDNDRAQQMLLQMESQKKQQSEGEDIVPGVSRRKAIIYGGSVIGVWLLLMIVLVSVGVNRRATRAQQLTSTAQVIAQANTEAAQVQTDQAATELALAETQTSIAQETAVAATATAGQQGGGSLAGASGEALPPTWTPTAPADAPNQAGPTATPLPGVPQESFDDVILIGWGGVDRLNNEYYPITGYQLGSGQNRQLGDVLVSNVDINPANGQELVFTRYFPQTFDFGIILSNLSITNTQRIANAWEPIDFLLEPQQVSFAPDGSGITFIAPNSETNTDEVYYLNLNISPQPGVSPLQRITRDEANYSDPAISPDNTQIAAIRRNPQDLDPGPDLVIIQIDGGLQQIIKEDGSRTIEQQPAWNPADDNLLAFSGRAEGDTSTYDIVQLNVNNAAAPATFLVRDVQSDATHPVFSPDGNYLAFASDRSGGTNIFIRNLQTEEIYQVTNDNQNPQFPGGWYIPGAVDSRPQIILPTPIITSGE